MKVKLVRQGRSQAAEEAAGWAGPRQPAASHTSTAWRARGADAALSLYNQMVVQNNTLNSLHNSLTLQFFLKFSYKRFIQKFFEH